MRLRWNLALLIALAPTIALAQLPTTTKIAGAGGTKVVLVDPVSSFADLSKAKRADLILVTDIHPDHLDAAAIAKLRKPGAPVVVPPAVAEMKQIPDPTVMSN